MKRIARGGGAITTPTLIQALGIAQDGSPTRWKATGYVDGAGWLEAWGKTLVEAMERLQAKAGRVAEQGEKADVGRRRRD